MHFNYFVIAALATVSAHALSIYNIIAQVPSFSIAGFNNEVKQEPSITEVPQFCQDDVDTSKAVKVSDLKQCLKTRQEAAGKSFFFANPYRPKNHIDYLKQAVKWRKEHQDLKDLMLLDNFWLDDDVKKWAYAQAQRFTDAKKSQRNMFWTPASRAMAELSSGIVRVIMPEDVDPVHKPADVKGKVIWYDVECPTLARNNKVKEVYKVWPGSEDKAVKVDYKECGKKRAY